MLEIDMEFRKGILFVRLIGELTVETVDILNKEVTNMIRDYGLGNIVFNVEKLENIDIKGINSLLYNYELVNKCSGKALLCGLKNTLVKHRIEHSRLLKYMYETSDELTALSYIQY